jgi:two-component system sensor histidine kinase KdpD
MIASARWQSGGTPAASLSAIKRELLLEPMGYWAGALSAGIATALAVAVAPHASLAHVMVIYLLGAVLVATRYGVAVSTFTIATSALCFDYFNIPPIFAFAIPDPHSAATLGGMLLTAIVMCSLLQRLRHQRTLARASEARTLSLCELSLDLSAVASIEALLRAAQPHLTHLFGASACVFVRNAAGEIALPATSCEQHACAQRALRTARFEVKETEAGTLAYQPITSRRETLGLVCVMLGSAVVEQHEQRVLLAACADRIAVAIDRLALGDAARRAHVEVEAERLRNELLSAMSHDLRTPLASILTAGTTLLKSGGPADHARRELLETIVDETERLDRLVTNLMSVTRLESGRVRLNKAPEALDELAYGVLSRLSGRLEGRAVVVDVPDDLPFVAMDSVLVDQVLVNLLENVLRYTPAGSPLAIRMRVSEGEAKLEVADRGPGIPVEEREKVFEKFYRGTLAKRNDGGSGLGLTICRAVARAHGGQIRISAREGGGTVVEFVLPAHELRPLEAALSAQSQEVQA